MALMKKIKKFFKVALENWILSSIYCGTNDVGSMKD